jgi:4-hydroxy-2-oxoheptanedioate aldolase
MTLYPPNALKRKLARRETALGFWLSLNSRGLTEMAAGAGFDWLLLDAEHSVHDLESIEQHVLAAYHAGTEAELVVRVPSVEPNLVKGLLDAGVRSFMFPFVQSVAEARLAVAATRYPPSGIRGYSGTTRANRYGRDATYLETYADDICVILQVESPQAVENIAEYGRIDGVDAILIGANDLAANMGHLGDVRHPEVTALFDRAAEAILATGKAAGFQFFDHATAQLLLGRGFTLAAVGGDMFTIASGTRDLLAALRR